MALRRFGVLVVAAVLGVVVGLPPALGTGASAKNGRIAFIRRPAVDGDYDIWTMRPNGKNLVNLTADSDAFDAYPRWRTDGRKIAFISNRGTTADPGPQADTEIFVMNADGSKVRQITFNADDDEAPSWSPDGRKIVFQRDFDPVFEQTDYDLFTMNADGTRQRNITDSPGISEYEAAWSPNGRRIAFASDRDGDDEIYTMSPDGSRVQQLIFNDAAESGASWSPDGHKIAFYSDRDGNEEIYTMRANGSDQTRLTFDVAPDFFPDWSPDGRRIAFASERDATENKDNAEIYTMLADGGNQTRLTRTPDRENGPDWQPLHKRRH